jgi:hypothetical protein
MCVLYFHQRYFAISTNVRLHLSVFFNFIATTVGKLEVGAILCPTQISTLVLPLSLSQKIGTIAYYQTIKVEFRKKQLVQCFDKKVEK